MLLRDLLYLIVLAGLSPWLLWRALRTGRYRRDLAAKLVGGRPAVAKGRPVAWFHGVSVGEIHLLVTVVAAFRARHPDFSIVISSTTDTGLAEARARFADRTVIAFPFDFSWAARTTLDAVRPAVVILAESELWPNFLAAAGERGVPVVVINARLSPRSFARLNRVAGLARSLLFRHVTAFAVQSDDYAGRLRQLGVSEAKLTVTGSVKFDGATADRDTPKARELSRLLSPPPSVDRVLSPPPLAGGGLGGRGNCLPLLLVEGRCSKPPRLVKTPHPNHHPNPPPPSRQGSGDG